MTTLIVTNEAVLVDSRYTWDATSSTQTKVHQYGSFIYTASGAVGGGQVLVYRFIDELLDVAKPWPNVEKAAVNASYVLIATEDVPHRHISKGDVICIDVDEGAVYHDENLKIHELSTLGSVGHLTKYVCGSGASLYQTFLSVNPDPLIAFELAVEHDPYSDFPYQRIDRKTCTVHECFRLTDKPYAFACLATVAGFPMGQNRSGNIPK